MIKSIRLYLDDEGVWNCISEDLKYSGYCDTWGFEGIEETIPPKIALTRCLNEYEKFNTEPEERKLENENN